MSRPSEASLASSAPLSPPLRLVRSPRAAAERGRRWRQALRSCVIGGISLCVWLGLWQLACVQEWDFFFRFENVPSPTEVVAAAGALLENPKLLPHVLSSVQRIF